MRYPVVLLDVGETLIAPREPFGATYGRVFGRAGIVVSPERFEQAIRELIAEMPRTIQPGRDRYAHYPGGESEYWRRFVERALDKAGAAAPPRAARAVLEPLREAFGDPASWHVYPDVVPALTALRSEGVRLGVVSNWDSRLPGLLEALGLAGYFDALSVSHIEGLEKPDPELFRRVLHRLEARPEQALHVGDAPDLDLAGARAAGIDGLLVDRRRLPGSPSGALADLSGLAAIARCGLDATHP